MDIKISRGDNTFVSLQKPTFSEVFTNFERFFKNLINLV